MEIFVKRVPFPKLPEHLTREAIQVISDPKLQARILSSNKIYGGVGLYETPLKELQKVLTDTIGALGWRIHYFNKDFPIHIDPYCRTRLMYILEPGGLNVRTGYYDDDQVTQLTSEHLQVDEWCLLNTIRYHDVQGIDPGKFRYAITARIHTHPINAAPELDFFSTDYSRSLNYPPLEPGVFSELIEAVQDSTLREQLSKGKYVRYSLQALGLERIAKWLDINIQPGDWYIEQVNDAVELTPSPTAVELSTTLLHTDEANIKYSESQQTTRHVNVYKSQVGHWNLNVANCWRVYKGHQVNLVCRMLGN